MESSAGLIYMNGQDKGWVGCIDGEQWTIRCTKLGQGADKRRDIKRDNARGATIFFGMGGHKFPKVPRQYFCDPPYLMIKKIYDPPPPRATMLKKYARSMENMHFGAISLNKIFIKICSHPIISWFFLWPTPISHEKFCDPQLFHGPPIRKKMIAPKGLAVPGQKVC